MAMDSGSAIGIGSFQFNNLVTLRIPFILCHEAIDFSKYYGGEELRHLQKYSQDFLPAAKVAEFMKAQGIPSHWPVLWICKDGLASRQLANEGETAGLINCHYLEAGISAFVPGDGL